MKATAEREIKLGAPPGFVLPDLSAVAPGVTVSAGDERILDATYYDVDDLRLIRSGVTLRHRIGDGAGEGTWTVKLPDPDGGVKDGLARTELEVDGPPGAIPKEVAAVVASRVRTGTLTQVARLRTTRRRLILVGADAAPLAEVDDDEVEVLEDGSAVATFREIEVELAGAASPQVLAAIVRRLRIDGAGAPDPTPKLARALGPRAFAPPELAPVRVGKRSTAAEVVRTAITASVLRIVVHDPVVREGVDPEGVHQARVGTRRLRSDLRTFGPLLEASWAEPLRDELAWLADALGDVRDADVLVDRLRAAAASLPTGDHAVAEGLLVRLDAERSAARDRLVDVLDSDRYAWLLDRLIDASTSPSLSDHPERPAAEVLAALARQPWKKLRREVLALGDDPADEALHRVRIRAKRARYAADVAVPVVGAAASELAKAVAALQDGLGDQHDAVVAETWLRSAVAEPRTPARTAFVIGELIGLQRADAARLRGEWPAAWKAAVKGGRTGWLS